MLIEDQIARERAKNVFATPYVFRTTKSKVNLPTDLIGSKPTLHPAREADPHAFRSYPEQAHGSKTRA